MDHGTATGAGRLSDVAVAEVALDQFDANAFEVVRVPTREVVEDPHGKAPLSKQAHDICADEATSAGNQDRFRPRILTLGNRLVLVSGA